MSEIAIGPRGARRFGRTLFAEIMPYACGVAVWQILSWLDIWPHVLFPSPTDVFFAFLADLGSGALLKNLGVSLTSLGWGFLVGASIAVLMGYLMGLNRASRDFFDPLINLLQAFQASPGFPSPFSGSASARAP